MTRAPENLRPAVRPPTAANLKLLQDHGVRLVVGSDNVGDTSVLEFEQLATLGVLDKLTLLKMWAEATPRQIFPDRQIGLLRNGYEAGFLALNGNPLEDVSNVRRVRVRFKQGCYCSDNPRFLLRPGATPLSMLDAAALRRREVQDHRWGGPTADDRSAP